MSARHNSRRDFLRGKAARDVVTDWLDAVPSTLDVSPVETAGRYLISLKRRAMACDFVVLLNAGQHNAGPTLAMQALDLIEELEAQLTIYRDSSEVLEINCTAAERPVVVEERLFELLQRAVALHRDTQGAYDITAGPLSKAWGFFRRQGEVPNEAALAEALAKVGSEKLTLDAERQTIALAQPGVELNLGAIGKGYALDRCAELLLEGGVDNFLIHGGQSSILARGARATGRPDEQGWSISIGDPLRPGKSMLEFPVVDRAVGTSGTQFQFFRHAGERYGHIIDPRTGWPAKGVLSCTVLAPTAAEADALSTAFFILGPEGAEAYCAARPETAALLVCPSNKPGEPIVHRFNWASVELAKPPND
ncbi:MAG: FAD:protein FMN transferase [Planctomycetia bacterium]|nr:FAD:protein FMN transferase [Planctomycetia bacterium]